MSYRAFKFALFIAIPAFLFVFAAVVFLFQRGRLLEEVIRYSLAAQGFPEAVFSLSGFSAEEIEIRNLSLGGRESSPKLDNLKIRFSPSGLISRKIRKVSVSGLVLEFRKENGAWKMPGMVSYKSDKTHFHIPLAEPAIAGFSFEEAHIENTVLRFSAPQWRMELPLSVEWKREPEPRLSVSSGGAVLKIGEMRITAGKAEAFAVMVPGGEKWDGGWSMENLKFPGMEARIPEMKGEGKLSISSGDMEIEGMIASENRSHLLSFAWRTSPQFPEKTELEIKTAGMPWNEGRVSVSKTVLPMFSTSGFSFTLEIASVSAEALLKQIAGESASATGFLSGVLPVFVSGDGSITVQGGWLKTDSPGIIRLPPGAIPGDNENVALLRNALGNFRYSVLSAEIGSEKDGKTALIMRLEGNNPDVQAGRPFKVNVNLRGDVLDLVRRNVLLFLNPLKLREEGDHAKK